MATSRSIWPVMSRFARRPSAPVRTWAPPESPFRIEYSPALLREVRVSADGVDAFGVLYGVRHEDTIRLVATRGCAGLEPLGVFASRARGQVFLTEEDLGRFEKAEACVAMVISGDAGGFFVRDAVGSIETVRTGILRLRTTRGGGEEETMAVGGMRGADSTSLHSSQAPSSATRAGSSGNRRTVKDFLEYTHDRVTHHRRWRRTNLCPDSCRANDGHLRPAVRRCNGGNRVGASQICRICAACF